MTAPLPGPITHEELRALRGKVRRLQFEVLGVAILAELAKVVRVSASLDASLGHLFVVLEMFLAIEDGLIARPAADGVEVQAVAGQLLARDGDARRHARALARACIHAGQVVELRLYDPDANVIALPMAVDREVMGALVIIEPFSLAALAEHRVPLLAMIATQVGVVIKNAELFHSLRGQAAALQDANARLIELDHTKAMFLATISHELLTPLTTVLGNADLLLGDFLGDLGGEQRESVATIRDEGRELLGMIRSILELARLDAGALRLKPVPVALGDVWPVVRARAEARANERRQPLEEAIPPTLPAVLAEPERLGQVLFHLLDNASKFSPEGKPIRFEARHLPASRQVQFLIQDEGVGIGLADMPRVFNRFWQVESRANRRFGGLGLGLSLVKGLVEAMGGQVCFTSEEGRGSTFVVALPAGE